MEKTTIKHCDVFSYSGEQSSSDPRQTNTSKFKSIFPLIFFGLLD